MTDDSSSAYTRQAPRSRTSTAIGDFTMLVQVPGQPGAIRAFTEAERVEAEAYAASTGGTVVPLPLSAQPSAEGDALRD